MAESCCTEIKSSIHLNTWTVKHFTSLRGDMVLRSAVFSALSAHSSQPVSWFYELNPQKSYRETDYIVIDAFIDSTFIPRSRLHAHIVVECNNGNITNPARSGTVQAGSRIGKEMFINRSNVISYLVKDGTLTLGFKFTLFEEICNGVPEQQLAFQPDALLVDHYNKLLSGDKFSDITFFLGADAYQAHKAILSVRSPVFAAMFEHEMKESKESAVRITDIQSDVFQEMLRFIYTGSVQQLELRADELLIAAEKYALDSLKRMCEDHLATKLTVETANATLRLADTYNANQLKEHTINFISTHVKEMKTTDWKSLFESYPDVAAEMISKMALKH